MTKNCSASLGREHVLDATSLLKFRLLLEEHKLGAALLAKVSELLMTNGMRLSSGTIVDATADCSAAFDQERRKGA